MNFLSSSRRHRILPTESRQTARTTSTNLLQLYNEIESSYRNYRDHVSSIITINTSDNIHNFLIEIIGKDSSRIKQYLTSEEIVLFIANLKRFIDSFIDSSNNERLKIYYLETIYNLVFLCLQMDIESLNKILNTVKHYYTTYDNFNYYLNYLLIVYLKNAHLSLIGGIDNFEVLLRFIMFIYSHRLTQPSGNDDVNPPLYGGINFMSLFRSRRRRIQPEPPRINEIIEITAPFRSSNYLSDLYQQNKLEIDRIKQYIQDLLINREILNFINEITDRNNETMREHLRLVKLNSEQIATFIFYINIFLKRYYDTISFTNQEEKQRILEYIFNVLFMCILVKHKDFNDILEVLLVNRGITKDNLLGTLIKVLQLTRLELLGGIENIHKIIDFIRLITKNIDIPEVREISSYEDEDRNPEEIRLEIRGGGKKRILKRYKN